MTHKCATIRIEYITDTGGMGRVARCISGWEDGHYNIVGTGVDALEALTDLKMKIAGDDFERVEAINVDHRRF